MSRFHYTWFIILCMAASGREKAKCMGLKRTVMKNPWSAMEDRSNTVPCKLRGNAKVSILDGVVNGFAYTPKEFAGAASRYCSLKTFIRHVDEFAALLVLFETGSVRDHEGEAMETYNVTNDEGLRGVSVVAVLVERHVDVDQISIY